MSDDTPGTGAAAGIRLPDLQDRELVGGRWIYRSVSLVLAGFGMLIVAGLGVAYLVTIDTTVTASGVLEPAEVWPLRPREAGVVERVLVEQGDTVEVGQVVAQLDSAELAGQLAELESAYRVKELEYRSALEAAPIDLRENVEQEEQARAELVRATANLRAEMAHYGLGTNVDSARQAYEVGTMVAIDEALANVLNAEAELRSVRASREREDLTQLELQKQTQEMQSIQDQMRFVRERLEHRSVVSSAAGVVLTEDLDRMEGAYLGQGETLLRVASTRTWRLHVLVSERDVGEIQVGNPMTIEFTAFRSAERQLVKGRISYISIEPTPVEQAVGSGHYRVEATLDSDQLAEFGPDRLRRGYTAEATIITGEGRIIDLLWDLLNGRSGSRT